MDLEHTAIERLKTAAEMSESVYGLPLVITYSGGKDSDVCLELARRSGIRFEIEHNHTTADAPETVYHVRNKFKTMELEGVHCSINYPIYKNKRVSMWSLILINLTPPTRVRRYCCEVLKEQGGKNRFIVTGIRWAESFKRKNNRGIYESGRNIILNNDNDNKRQLFESCKMKGKRICNPIVDWSDRDVWSFLKDSKVKTNPLYQCGFCRVGCIGCPMAGKSRYIHFEKWPTYKTAYINSFGRMLDLIHKRRRETEWKTKEDVFHWWMEDGYIDGQQSLFEGED